MYDDDDFEDVEDDVDAVATGDDDEDLAKALVRTMHLPAPCLGGERECARGRD